MCATNMEAHIGRSTLEYQRYEKQEKKFNSHAAKKGAKKLVSSDCVQILDKGNSN